MTRTVLISLISAVSLPAIAQDHTSEPRLFRFEEIKPVRQSTLSIPLQVDVISGVVEGLGATPTLRGDAEIGLYLEGESNLGWPVLDAEKSVAHTITPLENSSFIGMSSNMQLTVEVGATIVGNPLYFQIVSEEAKFEDEVSAFTPFLLPYQGGDTGMILQPQATSGKFQFPISIPIISGGVIEVAVGVILRATPVSESQVYGDSLDTIVTQDAGFVDTFSTDGSDITTDGVFQNVVELYEQTPELELTNQWISTIGTRLGYLVGVDFSLTIGAFGFSIPFSFNLYEETFDIFPYLEESQTFDAHPETAPYFHPLPMVDIARENIQFTDQQVGESKTFKFGVINEGLMDLEGTVSIQDDGSGAFSFSPPDLSIEPGGQQAVNVTFSPAKEGEFRGKLILETSDPAQPTVEVPIVGTSIVPSGTDGDLQGNDNGGLYDQGQSTIYETCGCAATTYTPAGLAPFALLPALVMVRRRKH